MLPATICEPTTVVSVVEVSAWWVRGFGETQIQFAVFFVDEIVDLGKVGNQVVEANTDFGVFGVVCLGIFDVTHGDIQGHRDTHSVIDKD